MTEATTALATQGAAPLAQEPKIKGRGPVVLSCQLCGDVFRTYPSDVKIGGGKFCSWKCSKGSRRVSRDPRDHAERFWSKVDKSGGPDACWPWTDHRRPPETGYGCFGMGHDCEVGANRMAWALANDQPIPPTKEPILHSCDFKPCCNPAHLSKGTSSRNNYEAYERNRRVAANQKLTADGARWIVANYSGRRGEIGEIARKFGVSHAAVSSVIKGRQWKRAIAEGAIS